MINDDVAKSWYVDINNVRTDYPKIENLEQFIVKEVPLLPKYHPNYVKFWSREAKRCIEGVWGKMFGKWRYMPGNLYFFGNYGVIEDTKIIDGVPVTKHFKPRIVDYFWEFAAMSWAAYGFSGFEKDDEYSCHRSILDYEKGDIKKELLHESCISSTGEVKKYVEAFDYILKLHDKPLGKSWFLNESRDVIVMGCLGGAEKVRMFDGSTKCAKDIIVGDNLMGPDSQPREVKELVRGTAPMVKVQSKYGEPFICSDSHILHLKESKVNRGKKFTKNINISVGPYLDKIHQYSNTYASYEAIQSDGIDYPESTLPLDPYFIGLWLGDGFSREKLICGSVNDTETLEWLKAYADSDDKLSYSITQSCGNGIGNGCVWRFRLSHSDFLHKENWWAKTFRNNKHIPSEYLISSKEQRLALLAGFIDSDGCYEKNKNRFTITNNNLELLKQTQELARSLGFIATIGEGHLSGIAKKNLKYNLRIRGKITSIPTKLARKKAIKDTSSGGRDKNRIQINGVGVDDFYGFEVDKDNLFLLADYTVTHNSRSGGKSYWVGIGELEYNFVFSGARRYDRKYIDNKLKCRQVVGSADTTKSAELYDKFIQSQNAKTNNKDSDYVKWFGVYTETYYDTKGNKQEKITPCPFYRHTVGNLDCPNKLNPLKAVYKVKRNGEYQKEGVGSELVHVNYSTKKGDGAQAAVGGRYLFSDVEEVGLVQNYIEVLGSNKSALRRNGRKNGVSWSQGTSGNITFVQEAKKVFLNPQDYDTIAFKSKFNKAGKEETTGYFIPNYMVHFAYKDKDGNTNYEEAIGKINKERKKSAESKDPNVLRDHLMNEPCYIDEMWITNKGDYFHNQELTLRERQLTTGNKYQELETCVKLFYNPEMPRGIGYDILHDAEPYRQFPHDTAKMKNPEGCVVIYDFPKEINGEIPPDMYVFIGHDPHGDGKEPGSSVASTYVLMNPKYAGSPYNLRGNTIVASWNGKPKGGLDEYYEVQEKLIQFYGSPPMSLMYERNKGADCRAHYIKKHKVHLLAPTPQFGQGTSMDYKNIRDFGYYTGAANFGKASMAKHIDDWTIEWTELDDKYPDGGKRQNWERIPCLYLIRQMMQYNLEDNFDAVDGFRGCILGLREHTIRMQADTKKTNKPTTTFQGILNNNRIFQQRLNAKKT